MFFSGATVSFAMPAASRCNVVTLSSGVGWKASSALVCRSKVVRICSTEKLPETPITYCL